jgi:cob(I)alamin adenosyltransferase
MGYRLSKIYTRTGDDGKTQVGVGERIPKNHLRIEALGTLDELNCAIGLMLTNKMTQDILSCLTQIQHELFNLGGELCPPYHVVITPEKISQLEQYIDQWNESLPPLKEFLLPGGNISSAHCHLARAICRRAERCLVALNQETEMNSEMLRYINRLSDLLFVLARVLNNQEEKLWEKTRKSE